MKKAAIEINGYTLTLDHVHRIARERVQVELCPDAMALAHRTRQFVLDEANKGLPVYGFTRGVGLNLDRMITSEEYAAYNRNLILSHCVGIGPECSEDEVRAIMLARLNPLLLGFTGIQPEIIVLLKNFLNHSIHPIIPERGSVGEADITCLSHIGLALIGEGEVIYKGTRMEASKALDKAGLQPVKLGPKDGLAIVSSNAVSAGTGALLLFDCMELLELADIIYALSLEGFQGNVTPLDESISRVKPFPGQMQSVEHVRQLLHGSSLFDPVALRKIQDPLSFRGACQIHGSVRDALEYAQKFMLLHLNSSDDNPCVLLEEQRIVSCSNYESTTLSLGFEMLGMALSHLSKTSCYRTIKLSTPHFTGLTRFLAPPDSNTIAFSTIQKTFTSLDMEIRHLSNPASSDYYSLAGDMEDHANNTPYVVKKTAKIVDNIRYILGMEAMHAAQAIDLRSHIHLGQGTQAAYDAFRAEINFLYEDRNLSLDIEKAYHLLKKGSLLQKVRAALMIPPKEGT